MADSISTTLDVPEAARLVERLTSEGLISMREAAKLYGRTTHKSTATRHAVRGVKLPDGTVIRLEAIRVSGSLVTSRAAVLRFFAAQNQTPEPATPAAPAPTPKQRKTAAAAASKEAKKTFRT